MLLPCKIPYQDNTVWVNVPMLNYEELNNLLKITDSDSCAADCHGFLCGHICVSEFPDRGTWEDYLDLKSDDTRLVEDFFDDIGGLVAETVSLLESPELQFHPLLPDDYTPLSDRVEALSEWCHGFLNGFGMGQDVARSLKDEEGRELIENFTRICQLQADDTPDESNEKALFELVEYVRMGAMFIYGQFKFPSRGEGPEVYH
jgi:uncharacterized protein YgfB (UPF0149 family)